MPIKARIHYYTSKESLSQLPACDEIHLIDSEYDWEQFLILTAKIFPNEVDVLRGKYELHCLSNNNLLLGYFRDYELLGTFELCCMTEQTMYVANIQVNPNYRSHGIATHLFHAAEELASRMSYQYFYLTVRTQNIAARHIYQKWGFSQFPASAIFSFNSQLPMKENIPVSSRISFTDDDFEKMVWTNIKTDYCEFDKVFRGRNTFKEYACQQKLHGRLVDEKLVLLIADYSQSEFGDNYFLVGSNNDRIIALKEELQRIKSSDLVKHYLTGDLTDQEFAQLYRMGFQFQFSSNGCCYYYKLKYKNIETKTL